MSSRPLFSFNVVDQPSPHRLSTARHAPRTSTTTRYAARQMASSHLNGGLHRVLSVDYPVTLLSESPLPQSRVMQILPILVKGLVLVLILFLVYFVYRHHNQALRLLTECLELRHKMGHWYPLLFLLLHVCSVACFLPAELLTICGGFIFTYQTSYPFSLGMLLAISVAMTSLTIVCSIHFAIGRYGLRTWAERIVDWSGTARLLKDAVTEGGLVAALMIRLVPIIPFGLGSLMLGMTDLPPQVVICSVVGALPLTAFFCWIGSQMNGLASILHGHAVAYNVSSKRGIIFLSISALTVTITAVYFAYLIRRRRPPITQLRTRLLSNKAGNQISLDLVSLPNAGEPFSQTQMKRFPSGMVAVWMHPMSPTPV